MKRSVFFLSLGLAFLSSTAAWSQAELRPPQVVERSAARYPRGVAIATEPVKVVLTLTIDSTGELLDAQVTESGGQAFDDAALVAVSKWKFKPARRGDENISAKIQIPFLFETPEDDEHAEHEHSEPAQSPAERRAEKQELSAKRLLAEDEATFEEEGEIIVVGRARPSHRGASDFTFRLGELSKIPRNNAAELLKLAPGILLTNEGGEGHAQQVFLRGFDAREGQDIEFSVDGVPINQVGNIHGNGFADTHFIIPELVEELRVLEGPFEPAQGNFAVAGSADYRLGLERRGLTLKYLAGSFDTQRLLLLWGPQNESHHTFGGVEYFETEGFGQNRAARRGSAIGQYEWRIGRTGLWRLTGQAYAVDYKSAGVLRQDDYLKGNKRFFDSYDPWQGGSASRFSIASDVEQRAGDMLYKQQVFVVRNAMRLKENYTGYLLDVQEPLQDIHTQRGDRIDKSMENSLIGARGSARFRREAFGQPQEVEFGYLARGDEAGGTQDRVQSSNAVPYAREVELESRTANIGLYADVSLKPSAWFTLKGGLRGEVFAYDVLNRCAVSDVRFPSGNAFEGDAGCFSQQPTGEYRLPEQRTTTAGNILLPRITGIFGPFEGFAFSAAWGRGARAIDPQYVNQDGQPPFSAITAYEGGVVYAKQIAETALVARSIFFQTEVEQDYLFSQTAGRNTLAEGTTRTGWIGAVRATGSWFDLNANLTLVRSVFDDTGLAIPYVPSLVSRMDMVVFDELPWSFLATPISANATLGGSYVAKRSLPYSEQSDELFTVDVSAGLSWRGVELGLQVSNLFDNRYRLGEYNYPSDFSSQPSPTLVPARHFSAGPPRAIYGTLALHFGED